MVLNQEKYQWQNAQTESDILGHTKEHIREWHWSIYLDEEQWVKVTEFPVYQVTDAHY